MMKFLEYGNAKSGIKSKMEPEYYTEGQKLALSLANKDFFSREIVGYPMGNRSTRVYYNERGSPMSRFIEEWTALAVGVNWEARGLIERWEDCY
jgi:hypothetical protein